MKTRAYPASNGEGLSSSSPLRTKYLKGKMESKGTLDATRPPYEDASQLNIMIMEAAVVKVDSIFACCNSVLSRLRSFFKDAARCSNWLLLGRVSSISATSLA
jgi:hypothetical protein